MSDRPVGVTPEITSKIVFAGLDGCRGGWALALWQPGTGTLKVITIQNLGDLIHLPLTPAALVVDMPIRLDRVARAGGRRCDLEGRALLPAGRKSSIFSAPTSAALNAWRAGGEYADVLAAQRNTAPGAPGLSLQAYHLLRHIDALHRFIEAQPVIRCFEGHPELTFHRLRPSDRQSLASKHTSLGLTQRQQILQKLQMPWSAAWEACGRTLGHSVIARKNDVLDACVLAHVAYLHYAGQAHACPQVSQALRHTGVIFF
jgi:predicted RNase H-like nuclease